MKRAAELHEITGRTARPVPRAQGEHRLDDGPQPVHPRTCEPSRAERNQRRIRDHRHATPLETHLANERGERRHGPVADQHHAHAGALELGEARQEPVDLTGRERSAEVAEKDDQRGAVHEVAEATAARQALHLGQKQLRGERLARTHPEFESH